MNKTSYLWLFGESVSKTHLRSIDKARETQNIQLLQPHHEPYMILVDGSLSQLDDAPDLHTEFFESDLRVVIVGFVCAHQVRQHQASPLAAAQI
jgi:hypothetical protein